MGLRGGLVVVYHQGVAGRVAHALPLRIVRARQVDHAIAELTGEPVGPVQGLRWEGKEGSVSDERLLSLIWPIREIGRGARTYQCLSHLRRRFQPRCDGTMDDARDADPSAATLRPAKWPARAKRRHDLDGLLLGRDLTGWPSLQACGRSQHFFEAPFVLSPRVRGGFRRRQWARTPRG